MRRFAFAALLLAAGVFAQTPAPPVPDPSSQLVWVCPMDKDIRSLGPGNCPRCGMKLTTDVPDPAEYHMNLLVTPRAPEVNKPVHLVFDIHDPWKNNKVTKFTVVHEKLFHAFIVSEDLEFFVHDHPYWKDNTFQYDTSFPKAGMYRILGDFFPEAATPQLIAQTVIVPGEPPAPVKLKKDYSIKNGENLKVELETVPPEPIAGQNTQLRFLLSTSDGLEKYLGAWGHMLAASDDLIDMAHTHPFIADGSTQIQFNLTFPRPRAYRVWVQFQRNGVVNTVHFDVPVKELGL
jgi:Heavy metal binding domain